MLHSMDVIHRDIKLSNILLNSELEPKLLLADFSSSLSDNALEIGLFGLSGPTQLDLTLDYAPPEVRLSDDEHFSFDADNPFSYDVWSIGVAFLELILGECVSHWVQLQNHYLLQVRSLVSWGRG